MQLMMMLTLNSLLGYIAEVVESCPENKRLQGQQKHSIRGYQVAYDLEVGLQWKDGMLIDIRYSNMSITHAHDRDSWVTAVSRSRIAMCECCAAYCVTS